MLSKTDQIQKSYFPHNILYICFFSNLCAPISSSLYSSILFVTDLGATKAWAPATHAAAITADFIFSGRVSGNGESLRRFG